MYCVGREEFLLDAFHAELLACQPRRKQQDGRGTARMCVQTICNRRRDIISEMKHVVNLDFVSCKVIVCKRT